MGKHKKTHNITGDLKEKYSFWFGEPTEIYDAKSTKDQTQDEWDWYMNNMVSESQEENGTDPNFLIGKFPETHKYSGPVKLGMRSSYSKSCLNTLVVGNSGSGKTFSFVKPNIAQMNASYVVTDPGGQLLQDMGKMLQDHGYQIYVFNIEDPEHSHIYNPLDYIYDAKNEPDQTKISTLINCISRQLFPQNEDPFWEKTTKAWLTFAVNYVTDFLPEHQRNFSQIMRLARLGKSDEESSSSRSTLDKMIDAARNDNPKSKCFEFYDIYAIAPARTRASILINIISALSPFVDEALTNATSTSYECKRHADGEIIEYIKDRESGCYIKDSFNIDFTALGHKKTALFIVTPALDSAVDFLIPLLHHHALEVLHEETDRYFQETSRSLPIHIRFFINEQSLSGQTQILYTKYLATALAYNISFTVLLQTLSSSRRAQTGLSVGLFGTLVFLGNMDIETCRYIADSLGTTIVRRPHKQQSKSRLLKPLMAVDDLVEQPLCQIASLTSLPIDECIVLIKGLNPMKLDKYKFSEHPAAKESWIYNSKNKWDITQINTPSCKFSDRLFEADTVQKTRDESMDAIQRQLPNIRRTVISDSISNEIMKGCTNENCTEPTKSSIGGIKLSPDSAGYKQYGKCIKLYTCEDTSCPCHPAYIQTAADLAQFLRIKNPKSASKKDILHAVIEIIEADTPTGS